MITDQKIIYPMRLSIIILSLLIYKISFSQNLVLQVHNDNNHKYKFDILHISKDTLYKEICVKQFDSIQSNFVYKWQFSRSGQLYWMDAYNIYQLNPSTGNSKVIYKGKNTILEFSIFGNDHCYVLINNSKNEGDYDNRFNPGLKLWDINLNNRSIRKVNFPLKYNMTNLSTSPDGNHIVFINTINPGENNMSFQLILYNVKNGKFFIIDSSKSGNKWFGNIDYFNSSLWLNNEEFLYTKYRRISSDSAKGVIEHYNIETKNKQIWFRKFPIMGFSWFGYYKGYLYYSIRNKLYKTNGENTHLVWKIRNDIFQNNINSGMVMYSNGSAFKK